MTTNLLHESLEAKKLDTRTMERNIERGVITADEYEKAIKKLSDDSENAQWISLDAVAMQQDEGLSSLAPNGKVTTSH